VSVSLRLSYLPPIGLIHFGSEKDSNLPHPYQLRFVLFSTFRGFDKYLVNMEKVESEYAQSVSGRLIIPGAAYGRSV
jgi:hypothetical protein